MADSSSLESDSIEALYLISTGKQLTGYKRELVTQQLTEIELQLLVCYSCSGFMRNACNTHPGDAMGCQVCVGSDTSPVGTVRTMVSNLRCVCPLKHRGCVWEGSLGEVSGHLSRCDSLVVPCGYSVYGCGKRMRRGELNSHREECKEYHTELMSVFMTDKIDQLERASSDKGRAILDLQLSVESLTDSVTELRRDREYLRPNGVLWRITQREDIIRRLQWLQQGRAGMQGRDATPINGPSFEIDSLQLRPQLVIESADKVTLQLVDKATEAIQRRQEQQRYSTSKASRKQQELAFDEHERPIREYRTQDTNITNTNYKWHLGGKCKVILVNPTNRKADWLKEVNTSQLRNDIAIKLTNIPCEVLLADEYNNNGTIEIQILFKTPYN